MKVIKNTARNYIKELLCQVRKLNCERRLKPNFIIVGAQKAGTTSLYDYINLHPDVVSSYEKEIHYFSKFYHKGDSWYRAHYENGGNGKITGEASPYYLFHPLAPERIKQFDPNIKIIILLRDPAERAYSHYKHQVRGGTEDLDFPSAIAAEAQRLANQKSYIINTGKNSTVYQHFSYKLRGVYLEQIQRYRESFPERNMLILSCEDMFEEPLLLVQQVWRFLGLNPYSPSGTLGPKNQGFYSVKKSDQKTIDELRLFYKPLNEELFEYLDRDFGWNDGG